MESDLQRHGHLICQQVALENGNLKPFHRI